MGLEECGDWVLGWRAGEVEEGEGGEALEEAGEDGELAGFGEAGAGFVDAGVESGKVFVGDGGESEGAVGVGGEVAVLTGEDRGGDGGEGIDFARGKGVRGSGDMGELDTLVGTDEVGAGVEPGAVTGGGEDRGQGGGGGALAVGASDEDSGDSVLRVAEGGAEHAHVGEVKLAKGSAGSSGG